MARASKPDVYVPQSPKPGATQAEDSFGSRYPSRDVFCFASFLFSFHTFHVCSRHAPSLIVLDDLDKIAPAEGEEAGPFNAQAARIAERLEDLIGAGTILSHYTTLQGDSGCPL